MDNNAEVMLRKRFSKTLEGKTLLLFTHRTSLLSLVDRIVVMDAGKVVADGPKETVLNRITSYNVCYTKLLRWRS